MRKLFLPLLLTTLMGFGACAEDFWELSGRHQATLLLSTYMTVDNTRALAADEALRARALEVLRANGLRKVYVEVYRGGTIATPEELTAVRDWLEAAGIDTAAGIATVPGGDVGVRHDGAYGWFNWQAEKTQNDLRRIVRDSAPIFDEFIVDDFVCTDDRSAESEAAKGERDWGQYRRDLLTELCRTIFVEPAREVNPDITMIIKYPQWYDLFHRFGYDPARMTPLFDRVYVGTETRGEGTQRFGFIPPYLGFNNYRWLADIAGEKIGGAWFDHGDCTAQDFLDQAWQSVAAGARELVLFSFNAFLDGHEGHALLRRDFEDLVALAALKAPRAHYVHALKTPNGEPGGDMYLLDFLGMLGVPVWPVSSFPAHAKSVLLTQGSLGAPNLLEQVEATLAAGGSVILSAHFINQSPDKEAFLGLAGISALAAAASPITSDTLWRGEESVRTANPVRLAATVEAGSALPLLEAEWEGGRVPLLTAKETSVGAALFMLNTHTYTQADFDAVNEVLLAPARLGLRELQSLWPLAIVAGRCAIAAPAGVSWQPVGEDRVLVQNYTGAPVSASVICREPGLKGQQLQLQPDAKKIISLE